MQDVAPIHLARAEAYRQQAQFRQAEGEYQVAIKLAPNDVNVPPLRPVTGFAMCGPFPGIRA